MINPMNEIYLKIKINVTIALVGYSGCGKSTLINLVFKELVAKTSTSATDVTTKCSEYYLPVNDSGDNDIGQIRLLDFPGISEDDNYHLVVEPEIKNKMKEYKDNMEQIDVALFLLVMEIIKNLQILV
jgi:predicted GTPase